MSNQSELLETVLQCAEYLDEEYVTTKILTLLGDSEKVQEVLQRKDAEAADRYKDEEIAELKRIIEELRKANGQSTEPAEEPVEE
jgi:hypothetical protein